MPIRLTPAVKVLLIVCFAVFLIQNVADQFLGGNFFGTFGLTPAEFVVHFKYWQILTYPYLHADVSHLVLNLLMIAFIGGELEDIWGSKRFVIYYTFCSFFAGLCYLFLQLVFMKSEGLHVPMVGASGSIYGLLIAYGIIFGERMMLFMMLFPMKAKHFVWILAGVEFMTLLFSRRAGLSSVAHLGGMLGGLGYLLGHAHWNLKKREREQRKRDPKSKGPPKKTHLKLVINNVRSFEKDPSDPGNDPKTWH